ncbi:MAG: protein kinase [Acidobacteria bacterium]|nr:protein kinase [Acidobacteriota bacterium]
MSSPQDLIADRYRLQRRIAAGGMGVVWEARDELLRRPVAVKQLRTQVGVPEDEADLAKQRAMREARITARLHHPNAVPVFDAVEHDGEPCLVMQYVPSEPLSALIKRRGPLPVGEVAGIGASVAAALAAAHALGIVHRDVKPGNILIADADGTALLSDFGISHALGDATLTSTGFVHGTPAYLAPEVARGDESTFASDVFSLGSTLYAASEGRAPFGEAPNSIAVLHRVASGGFQAPRDSGALGPLLLQMMASDPAARPTMRQVARRLAAVQVQAGDAPVPTLPLVSDAAPAESAGLDDPDQPTAWVPVTSEEPATLVVAAPGLVPQAAEEPHRPDGASVPAAAEAGTAVTATAETRPAPTAPPDPASAPPDAPPPHRPSGPRRRGPLIAVLIVLLLLLGGFGLLRGIVPTSPSHPQTSHRAAGSVPPSSPASTPVPTSAAPTRAASTSPDPSSTPAASVPPPSVPAGTAPPKAAAATPVAAIEHYYTLVPGDTADAWQLMTAAYQTNHAGGRQSYDAFWAPVRSVSATQVRSIGTGRVEATITYVRDTGARTVEDTTFVLVEDGGVLKIADSSVVSSSG